MPLHITSNKNSTVKVYMLRHEVNNKCKTTNTSICSRKRNRSIPTMNGLVRNIRWWLPRDRHYRMLTQLPSHMKYTQETAVHRYTTINSKTPLITIPITIQQNQVRDFSASGCCPEDGISQPTYEYVCAETLESLNEYFEDLLETALEFKESDVTYGVRY